jgi:hypothetical protein
MFVDMPVNMLTNSLPLLYLPFKRTKRYFKHFPDSKGKKYLYVRFGNLPTEIQDVLKLTWKHLIHDIFVFFNPSTDELLGEYSLPFITDCLNKFEHKKELGKWMHTIAKTKKWNKTHPIYGKYMIVCSFLLHFAVSAHSLKKQFRLFTGKGG